MIETDNGHYVSSFLMPPASEETFDLIIQVAKENYAMEQEFHNTLVPNFNLGPRVVETLMENRWQITVGASMLVAAIVG